MKSVAVIPMDIHKKFSKAVVMDDEAGIIEEERVGHKDHQEMQEFFGQFEAGTPVVMEATFNWPWISDLAEEMGLEPHLAHPMRAREMAKGMAKTDRRDAIFLGRLWLAGEIFPESYRAPREVRRQRQLFRTRQMFVRMRTAIKNNIHGQLFRLGHVLDEEASDLFSVKGRAVLKGLELAGDERQALERKLAALDDLARHIEVLEKVIRKELRQDSRAEILMSLPGVGEIIAYGMLSEMGTMERFPDSRALAAYAGLLPMANESAEKDHGRHTGGACNHFLRWMMIEAVTGAVRGSGRMQSLYRRVKARNEHKVGKARVAVARELIELSHLLLARGKTYQETPPARPGSQKRLSVFKESKAGHSHPPRASQTPLCARSERSQAEV